MEKDFTTFPWVQAKEANTVLPGRFVEKSSWDVDIYAQATSSSNKYKEAVRLALEKAKSRPTATTTYFSGTFMGKSAVDGRGGWGIAWVTIQNDKITAVKLEETRVANETRLPVLKSPDNYTHEGFFTAREEFPARLIAAGPGGVATVDAIAGATSSSAKWKQAVQNALAAAKVK